MPWEPTCPVPGHHLQPEAHWLRLGAALSQGTQLASRRVLVLGNLHEGHSYGLHTLSCTTGLSLLAWGTHFFQLPHPVGT